MSETTDQPDPRPVPPIRRPHAERQARRDTQTAELDLADYSVGTERLHGYAHVMEELGLLAGVSIQDSASDKAQDPEVEQAAKRSLIAVLAAIGRHADADRSE